MTFEYSVYYRQNCIMPLFFSFFSLTVFVIMLFSSLKSRNIRSVSNGLITAFFLFVCAFLCVINLIPLFRGGIFLLTEKESDQIQITGTIDDTIEIDFFTGGKYPVESNHGNGEAIVVAGKKYYLWSYGDLEVNSIVKLSVLPRSRIVLRIDGIG